MPEQEKIFMKHRVPAILDTTAGQIAVIDICSTFENAARAGSQTGGSRARPGLKSAALSENMPYGKTCAGSRGDCRGDRNQRTAGSAPACRRIYRSASEVSWNLAEMFEISKDGTEEETSPESDRCETPSCNPGSKDDM